MTTLNLAGWCVQVICRSAALADAVAARYAPFATDAEPLITAHVCLDGDGKAELATNLDQLTVRGAGNVYQVEAPGFFGRFDFSIGSAELMLCTSTPLGLVEHFLRILYALLAYRQGGLLVHGAALLAGGGVSLFIGQSGSGKSTVTALSPFALALGDDLALVRPEGGGWRAFGTPFWNIDTVQRQGQTASGPVVGIYKLVQDTAVYLEPLSSAAAAAELVINCPVVNGDAARLSGLMARCREIAAVVPVQRLHFRKDPTFWDLLRRAEHEVPALLPAAHA